MNRNSNRKPGVLSPFPRFRPNSTSGFGCTAFQNRIFAAFRRFSLPVGPRNQAKRWESKSKKKFFNLKSVSSLFGSCAPVYETLPLFPMATPGKKCQTFFSNNSGTWRRNFAKLSGIVALGTPTYVSRESPFPLPVCPEIRSKDQTLTPNIS